MQTYSALLNVELMLTVLAGNAAENSMDIQNTRPYFFGDIGEWEIKIKGKGKSGVLTYFTFRWSKKKWLRVAQLTAIAFLD